MRNEQELILFLQKGFDGDWDPFEKGSVIKGNLGYYSRCIKGVRVKNREDYKVILYLIFEFI